jgi:hypothetical protein
MLAALPLPRRLMLWYRIGAYVRSNAWQLAVACDQRRWFRRGEDAGAGRPTLDVYDTWIEPLIDHPPGRAIAAALTWSWFHVTRISLRLRAHGINPVRQE